MNRYQNKKIIGLLVAVSGSLIVLPAIATPKIENKLLSQASPPPTASPTPVNPSDTSDSPPKPKPGIFNEAPYNRSRTAPQTPKTSPVIQPPIPEEQAPPSATITPIQGHVNVRLVNKTGANITYQVIGDTNARQLQGKSDVRLTGLLAPVTVTFRRDDGGLLSVTPNSPESAMIEVTLTETTDLSIDRTTMRIYQSGAVYFN